MSWEIRVLTPASSKMSRTPTTSSSSMPLYGPIAVSPIPAWRISPGRRNVTPWLVTPATTRFATLARMSGLSSPFCSVIHVAFLANLRSDFAAASVSYAFVAMTTKSARFTPAGVVVTSGWATSDVFPVILRPDRRIASAWSFRHTSVTRFLRERTPPKKDPIAPAPNTRTRTRGACAHDSLSLAPEEPRRCIG